MSCYPFHLASSGGLRKNPSFQKFPFGDNQIYNKVSRTLICTFTTHTHNAEATPHRGVAPAQLSRVIFCSNRECARWRKHAQVRTSDTKTLIQVPRVISRAPFSISSQQIRESPLVDDKNGCCLTATESDHTRKTGSKHAKSSRLDFLKQSKSEFRIKRKRKKNIG